MTSPSASERVAPRLPLSPPTRAVSVHALPARFANNTVGGPDHSHVNGEPSGWIPSSGRVPAGWLSCIAVPLAIVTGLPKPPGRSASTSCESSVQ